MSSFLYLLTLLAAVSNPLKASVDTIDGRQLEGELQSIDAAGVVIETPNGQARLTTRELVAVTLAPPESQAGGPLPQQVVFADGGYVFANAFALTDGQVSFNTKLSPQPVETPRSGIRYVQFEPLPPGNEAFWEDLAEKQLAGDVLVVKKRNGESLDFLTGVVENITEESIDFQWDGERIPVKRSKAAGILFFQKTGKPLPNAVVAVQFKDGSQTPLVKLESTPQSLQMTTPAGLQLETSLDQISKFDFSLGKLSYLSDLKPLAKNYTPLVALPKSVEFLTRAGEPRFDRSFTDSELTLTVVDEKTHKPTVVNYPKGIAIRSRTELIFQLPAGMRRFRALAGINPATASQGNVLLEISDRDQLLWQGEVAGGEAPAEIDIDVSDVRRLRIFVDYGKNMDYGDQLHLINARVTK